MTCNGKALFVGSCLIRDPVTMSGTFILSRFGSNRRRRILRKCWRG
jgi:hypothetical protein